jgi:hypothetical protein
MLEFPGSEIHLIGIKPLKHNTKNGVRNSIVRQCR